MWCVKEQNAELQLTRQLSGSDRCTPGDSIVDAGMNGSCVYKVRVAWIKYIHSLNDVAPEQLSSVRLPFVNAMKGRPGHFLDKTAEWSAGNGFWLSPA